MRGMQGRVGQVMAVTGDVRDAFVLGQLAQRNRPWCLECTWAHRVHVGRGWCVCLCAGFFLVSGRESEFLRRQFLAVSTVRTAEVYHPPAVSIFLLAAGSLACEASGGQ